MLAFGQMVMVIGDSRAPVGSCRTIADVMLCEFDTGVAPIYKLDPPVRLELGTEMLFQRRHLVPLDGEVETIVADEAFQNNG